MADKKLPAQRLTIVVEYDEDCPADPNEIQDFLDNLRGSGHVVEATLEVLKAYKTSLIS